MKHERCFTSVLISVLLVGLASSAHAQQTIFLVRHAEKVEDGTANPPLTAEGKARAITLRDALKDAGITAIFTSRFRRTKDTAQPLAIALALTPQEDAMSDPLTLIATLRHKHRDGNVLIVGHSDTVPKFLEALGLSPAPVIGAGDFDNLFVVVPGKITRPHVIRLRYKR